ncbi:MAG: polyamine aminopropyltransferase [Calditrichales bacterium]|nr:MAG: polyamine aminopropyltransferase [Calditrichales bacterium]
MDTLGRHILVEFYDCSSEVLNDVITIEKAMVDAAEKAGATIINSTFHHFSPFGVSGVVVIEESHLAVHTWPEYKYAAVDLFTCGEAVNPWISYNFLKEAFKAENGSSLEMKRGQLSLLEKTDFDIDKHRDEFDEKITKPKFTRNIWFTERNENIAQSFRHTGDPLFRKQSAFQKVEIYDTYQYGKMLTCDGMTMCTETDEHAYHEMISHVPLFTHPNPKKVLVIGGGDGGVVREIVRHESIEKVVMVEIDAVVIEASKIHLPTIASAFDHPKLELHIDDGIKYVTNAPDESFDVVIVDSTDPIGPAEGLFSEKFYRDVYRILTPNGLMVTQSESPRFNVAVFQEIYQTYRKIFDPANVHCYLAFIPIYPSGMWSFSYCAKGDLHPLHNFDQKRYESVRKEHNLQYYSNEVHKGAFALPGFVKELLAAAK